MEPLDAKQLTTVTVTFNPDLSVLESQLRSLPEECHKVVVDNGSALSVAECIERLCDAIDNATIIRNPRNLGLAAALNQGILAAGRLVPAPRFVLLLDQDSEPHPGSIARLLEAFHHLETKGERVGCVGPLLKDPETGLTHGFHQGTAWRWKRVYPDKNSHEPIPCTNINGSGTLAPLALLVDLHGLDESFFIDHVDTDWAFRVLAAGYGLWGVPDAVFSHRMGNASLKFWLFGWRVWPWRSPQRHYYLFRNALVLILRPGVPTIWRVWAIPKLFMTLIVHLFLDPERMQQVLSMLRGLRDGFRLSGTRGGRATHPRR